MVSLSHGVWSSRVEHSASPALDSFCKRFMSSEESAMSLLEPIIYLAVQQPNWQDELYFNNVF